MAFCICLFFFRVYLLVLCVCWLYAGVRLGVSISLFSVSACMSLFLWASSFFTVSIYIRSLCVYLYLLFCLSICHRTICLWSVCPCPWSLSVLAVSLLPCSELNLLNIHWEGQGWGTGVLAHLKWCSKTPRMVWSSKEFRLESVQKPIILGSAHRWTPLEWEKRK